jgi:hypothetical protein
VIVLLATATWIFLIALAIGLRLSAQRGDIVEPRSDQAWSPHRARRRGKDAPPPPAIGPPPPARMRTKTDSKAPPSRCVTGGTYARRFSARFGGLDVPPRLSASSALRDAAIIESRGRGDWRFASPLLRRYLAGIGLFE